MSTIYKHGSYEFKVVKKIGNGTFGEVYEVSLPNCDYRYALKKFSPTSGMTDLTILLPNELLRRFRQEIRYQSECVHPNIVSICVFHDTDNPFFVMDYADADLENLLITGMSKEEKISALLDVMNGLEYMHGKQLLHRDIKPANILKFGKTYKISDFGLIKNINENTHSQDINTNIFNVRKGMGTRDYMAPEVRIAGEYSEQTDIYALGVVMYELNIDQFDIIQGKATMQSPRMRYKSVTEMKKDVLELLGGNI